MANPNWKAGVSGNPGGRPKVVAEVRELARKHTTKAVQALAAILDDEKAPHSARVAAAGALLDRAAGKPPPAEEAVSFALPPIESAADAVKASASLVAAVASGQLTPAQASELGRLVESYVKALEATEFEVRLASLEQRLNP
jgi:hypothetical protein